MSSRPQRQTGEAYCGKSDGFGHLFKNAEAIGAISLLFSRGWRSHEAMAKDYLDQLKDAAERISDDLNAYV
ncbi:MAG: hypothetical protein ACTSSQ_06345 [Alphaproteobacteria bacterium]